MISVYNIAILVNTKASVRISIKRKSGIKVFSFYKLTETFDVCGTAAVVDI